MRDYKLHAILTKENLIVRLVLLNYNRIFSPHTFRPPLGWQRAGRNKYPCQKLSGWTRQNLNREHISPLTSQKWILCAKWNTCVIISARNGAENMEERSNLHKLFRCSIVQKIGIFREQTEEWGGFEFLLSSICSFGGMLTVKNFGCIERISSFLCFSS